MAVFKSNERIKHGRFVSNTPWTDIFVMILFSNSNSTYYDSQWVFMHNGWWFTLQYVKFCRDIWSFNVLSLILIQIMDSKSKTAAQHVHSMSCGVVGLHGQNVLIHVAKEPKLSTGYVTIKTSQKAVTRMKSWSEYAMNKHATWVSYPK